jgi:hypothetical protein
VVVPQGPPPQGQAATEAAAVAESAVENESELVQARPHRTNWARLRSLSHALNHASRHKHHAPGLPPNLFELDLEHCPNCGGELKVQPAVVPVDPDQLASTAAAYRPAWSLVFIALLRDVSPGRA